MRTRYGIGSPACRMRPRKRFAATALAFIAVYLVVFSAWQCASFACTGVEQTQLIESTFTVIGLECGGLLFKRVVDKVFRRKKEEE